jgi:GntR family transcriptional repressor for pyruvate dehydrogenase complex
MNELSQTTRGNDRIVKYFTDQILSGEMAPGVKLPSEGDLGVQFGASRTVVREAMQQLKARGVVETINGKGSYIAESRIDHFQDSLQLYSLRAGVPRDWMELLSLRSLIETECVRVLAGCGDRSRLESVEAALAVMVENQDDLGKFAEADIEFHHAIVSAADNRLYSAVWRSLQGVSLRFALDTYRSFGQVGKNLAEHELIYESMRAGHVEDAARAMTDHLASSRGNLASMLEDGE